MKSKTKGLNLKASGSKTVKKPSKRGPRLTKVDIVYRSFDILKRLII